MSQSQTTLLDDGRDLSQISSLSNVVPLNPNNRVRKSNTNLSQEPDESTVVYEARDQARRISIPPINIDTGYRAKIIIKKEKINLVDISSEGKQVESIEYNQERIIADYLKVLKEATSLQAHVSTLKEEVNTLATENELLKSESTNNVSLINKLREELIKVEIKPLKNLLVSTYGYIIAFLTMLSLISGLSMIGLHFIPSPIDKAMFWPSLAGAVGLYLDYLTKDKKYAD